MIEQRTKVGRTKDVYSNMKNLHFQQSKFQDSEKTTIIKCQKTFSRIIKIFEKSGSFK